LFAAGRPRIYVTNSAADTVDVIDSATNKIVQVIRGIELPHGINFSSDGTRVYVSSESESALDVIDAQSGEILRKIPLSGRPNNISITKDGRRVVVGIRTLPGALDIIDTSTLTLAKTIPINASVHNVYVTPTANTQSADLSNRNPSPQWIFNPMKSRGSSNWIAACAQWPSSAIPMVQRAVSSFNCPDLMDLPSLISPSAPRSPGSSSLTSPAASEF